MTDNYCPVCGTMTGRHGDHCQNADYIQRLHEIPGDDQIARLIALEASHRKLLKHVNTLGKAMDKFDDRYAPDGQVWVCAACGKTSPRDRFGDRHSSQGWDVSCTLTSVLCYEERDEDDKWVTVK